MAIFIHHPCLNQLLNFAQLCLHYSLHFWGADLGRKFGLNPNEKFPNIFPISDPKFQLQFKKKIFVRVVKIIKKY